jgi:3-oxoacyl-[acyl-carrier protein] reductase
MPPVSPITRSVLITGAATGIGAATARRFLKEGWSVALNYLDDAQLALAQQIGAGATKPGQKAIAVKGDVSRDADCRAMVAKAVEALGRLDALVNAAGISKMVPAANLDGLDFDDWQRIYAVNTIGPFQVTRAAAPHLRKAGNAAVVNIASRAALTGGGSSIAYAASKGALNTMTLSFARLLAPEVRVNSVCPTLTEGGFVERLDPETFDRRKAQYEATAPLRRIGTPDEVADAIWWLASGASMLTGAILELDNGIHLNAN